MDYVWEIIQPYVAAILAALGSGGIITLIVRAFTNKMLKKNFTLLDGTYNVDTFSQRVAERLAGKTLNIDVTAVTEKSLKKTAQALDKRIEKVEDAVGAVAPILIAIAKAQIKLKALSDAERGELASAINLLEKGYKPPEAEEIMTVQLTPIELNQEPIEIGEEPTDTDGGVNFGGLDAK
ncbi:hypothetical protein [Anaerocaecibacter muris]|uniref:hypothetical protein n=1 Tax=Anaerocaecibacter muris TaxID=2941513 RepID=UPI00203F08D9|nr:hypothetical protein [Anaerocaecibacter muris]MCX4313972.1 hypothetical protein [Clostridia bacterium]